MFFASAPAVFSLILVNVLASLYALYVSKSFLQQSLFSIERVRKHGEWYRVLTAGFLHGSFLHLFVNMYVLFMFGVALERMVGTGLFLVIYFWSQLAAKGTSLIAYWNKPDYASLGASGAVSGVLLSYCVLEPMTSLYFLGLVAIPAFVVAGIYIAYSMIVMKRQSRIAHEAHLGGALGGAAMTLILVPGQSFFF